MFVLGSTLGTLPSLLERAVGNPLLAFFGRRSLSMYIWHFPIYMYLYHHTDTWSWQVRTLLAIALIVVLAVANDFIVERRVDRLLRSSLWHRLDRGIPAYLAAMIGAARDSRAQPPAPVLLEEDTTASERTPCRPIGRGARSDSSRFILNRAGRSSLNHEHHPRHRRRHRRRDTTSDLRERLRARRPRIVASGVALAVAIPVHLLALLNWTTQFDRTANPRYASNFFDAQTP